MTLHGTGWPRAHASMRTQPLQARRIGGGLEHNQCTLGCRGRRDGFGGDGRERHYALGLLGADGAEESLALGQLGFATGDARRILGCDLGAAYDAKRGQHHEDRSAAPAAIKKRLRSNVRKPVDLRRSTDAV